MTFRFIIKELIRMYSSEESYFSKKRIESGIAFITGQVGMLTWLFKHISTMNYIEIIAWSGVEFAICGYVINQIQKEKSEVRDIDNKTE